MKQLYLSHFHENMIRVCKICGCRDCDYLCRLLGIISKNFGLTQGFHRHDKAVLNLSHLINLNISFSKPLVPTNVLNLKET
jgi:hypothetical protein